MPYRKLCITALLTIMLQFGDAQNIFVGANAGVNSCYLGGAAIKKFHNTILQQVNHSYYPGFNVGFVSDFYPLKTKQQIFLISINVGYQQYAQAISWSGTANNLFYYTHYYYYEHKINRELYYSLQAGVNFKDFILKTGLTFMQTVASSGTVLVDGDNTVLTNSANVKWPSKNYALSFNLEELLAVPLYLAYNVKLNDRLYISPELLFDFGVVGSNGIDFEQYGNVWGRIIKGQIGLAVRYSVLKNKK